MTTNQPTNQPTDTFVDKILGNSIYDILNEIHPLPDTITISRSEALGAARAVATVCGIIPGIIIGKLGLPVYMVPPLSFATSWWVCENLFPISHEYFGPKTIWHRAYDGISICSGIAAYYLVK